MWYLTNTNYLCKCFSFHVGSGCYDASAFASAVETAKTAFDYGVNKPK